MKYRHIMILSVMLLSILALGCSTSQETVTVTSQPTSDETTQPEQEPLEEEPVVVTAPTSQEPAEQEVSQEPEQQAPEPAAEQESQADVKTFVLTGQNFKYLLDGEENPTLRVSQGDNVRIEFTSTSGFHDWKLSGYDVATQKVNPGDDVTSVEFVADTAGEFEYFCSVGSHRSFGMAGAFIVE